LPKNAGARRREAATWLARLQSSGDPEVEQKFRQWYYAHVANAEAFERMRESYELARLIK
jgi:ferric-dicitrate binding protein FerR (iron transport regulator)